MTFQPVRILVGLALALLLAIALPVAANEGAPVPTVADSTSSLKPAVDRDSLTSIPTEEISRAAARTEIRLRALRASTRRGVEMQEIVNGLPELRGAITALAARTLTQGLAHQSRRYVQMLAGEWMLRSGTVSRWQTILASHVETLATTRKELQESAALWERTERVARRDGAPPAVSDRASATRQAILQEEAIVRSNLDEALELENTVSELQLIASDAVASIEAAIQVRRTSLFRLDGPPIWRWRLGDDLRVLREPGHLDLGGQFVRSMRDFGTAQGAHIRLHVFLALGVVLLVAWTYRRRHAWREFEPEIALFSRLLDRPVATAALLVLVVLTPLMYSTAPVSVYQMAAALAAPFLARLLSRLLPEHYVRAGYLVVVLYVIEPLPDLLAALPAFSGLVLLGQVVVALVVAFRADRAATRRGRTAIAPAIRFSSVLFGVALVAVLVGARSLAGLFCTGGIRAAYSGVLLYAAVVAMQGLWGLALHTRVMRAVRAVETRRQAMLRQGGRLIAIAGVIAWVAAALNNFYLLSIVGRSVSTVVQHRWRIGTLNVAIGDVLAFVFVIWLSVQLSRFVRFFLEDDVFPRIDLPRGVSATISTMVRYSLMALGLVAGLAAARIPLDRFTVLAGALGVGIGFGLQNIVNNFVSGLILVFERPVQVGDTVQVANYLGQIQRIGVRASTIRTFDGAEVLIPNATLISNDVVNWTLSDRTRRIEIPVGVAYGSDPSRVLALLVEVAGGHAAAMSHPAPQALFKGFGESALDFVVRFWTAEFDDWARIQSEVSVAIHDRLRDEGIEIPFPQRDLHVRTVTPAAVEALGGGDPDRGRPARDPISDS